MAEAAVIESVPELLSVRAAALRLGVPRTTIVGAILRSELVAVKSGDRILVRAESIDAYAAQHNGA